MAGPTPGGAPINPQQAQAQEEEERRRRQAAAPTFSATGQGPSVTDRAFPPAPSGQPSMGTFSAIDPTRSLTTVAGITAPRESHAQDISGARAASRQLLDEYGRTQPRPAPQATAGVAAAPTPATAAQAPTAAQAAASTVNAPAPVRATTVTGSTINPIERVTASRIGANERAGVTAAEAAELDRRDEAAMRDRLLGQLGGLEDVIAGRGGPSVAEQLLQRATEQNIANQASVAATARGSNIAAAKRMQGYTTGQLGQQGASDKALLRAQEIERARGQLLEGTMGVRGQDIGIATTEAGFRQGANLANAAAANETDRFNAAQTNTRNLSQAQLEQQAATGNAAAQNELSRRQAELNQAANLANQDTDLRANLANQQTALSAATTDANNQTNVSQTNAAQTNAVNTSNAGFANQTNLANMQADLQTRLQNADNETRVNVANMDAELRARGLDDAERTRIMNQYLESQGQVLNWDARAEDRAAGKKGWQDYLGDILGIGGQIGAAAAGNPALMSDRRQKKDIKPLYSDERGKLLVEYSSGGKDDPIDELLSKLVPSRYRYKDTSQDGTAPGERIGIMAQDLEKSKAGKALVIEENGVKKIDAGQAVGVLLAAMARMHQRSKGRR